MDSYFNNIEFFLLSYGYLLVFIILLIESSYCHNIRFGIDFSTFFFAWDHTLPRCCQFFGPSKHLPAFRKYTLTFRNSIYNVLSPA